MSRTDQEEMDMILNEVNSEFQGHMEQLQSDLEDAKDEIIRLLEGKIELRSKVIRYINENSHLRSDISELKGIIQTIEDRYDRRWQKQED